jgi:hypothetical protein
MEEFISKQALVFRAKQEASSERSLPARLEALANHIDAEVRLLVASNPNTPVSVLLDLGQEFPSQLLKNPILPILFLEDPNFLLSIPDKTLLALLCAYEAPLMLIEYAINHPREATKCFLAANEKTPDHILEALCQGSSEEVRAHIAKNARAPLRVLRWLAQR